MGCVKFQSRQNERTASGESRTVVYVGTQDEMVEMLDGLELNADGNDSKPVSARVYQDSGKIWCCEVKYQRENVQGGNMVGPDTAYGAKSATLNGGMLSMPLESNKNYLMRWNYYLIGLGKAGSTEPYFYYTAKTAEMSDSDRKRYRWIKTLSELPVEADPESGERWGVVPGTSPTKPGVETYDLATYQITESARFQSAVSAGEMVAGALNTIGYPTQTFGIFEGDWKCDSATVSWSGKYWLATLTWTKSGDESGWDIDLYE